MYLHLEILKYIDKYEHWKLHLWTPVFDLEILLLLYS